MSVCGVAKFIIVYVEVEFVILYVEVEFIILYVGSGGYLSYYVLFTNILVNFNMFSLDWLMV